MSHPLRLLRLSALAPALLAALACVPVFAVDQTVTIASPGSPEGVGFNEDRGGLAWSSPNDTKYLNLTIDGGGSNIINSGVYDVDGPLWFPPVDNGSCTSQKLWYTAPFLPKERYRARFEGDFCGSKGSSARWEAAVIMADIDADANNNSALFQRPPAIGGDEADKEDFAKRGSDLTDPKPGLFIGVNNTYQEGGKALASDPLPESGITEKQYPREDREKAGIFKDPAAINEDKDLCEGLLTLKLPDDVPGKAKLTYDTNKLRVYLVIGSDFALVPSGTLFRYGKTGPSITPATPGSRDGAILSFGEANHLKLEALKNSDQKGYDDIVAQLIPDKGKESHNRLAYTAIETNATRTSGDLGSAMKRAAIVYPTRALREHRGKTVKQVLTSDYPNYGWHAYVKDASSTTSSVKVKITSYDKDRNVIDTLQPEMREVSSGGKVYASVEKLWLVTDQSVNGAAAVSEAKVTINARPDGMVLIEYFGVDSTAICRKELLVPVKEEFKCFGFAGVGSTATGGAQDPTAEVSAAWAVGKLAVFGQDGYVTRLMNQTDIPDKATVFNTPAIPSVVEIFESDYRPSSVGTAKRAVDAWLSDDISQGGIKNRNMITVGNSWGGDNAAEVDAYAKKKYHFRPRFALLIDGIHFFLPVPVGTIGPAFICKNYYAKEGLFTFSGKKISGEDIASDDNFGFALTTVSVVDTEVPRATTYFRDSQYDPATNTGSVIEIKTVGSGKGAKRVKRVISLSCNDSFYLWERTAFGHYWDSWAAHLSAEWAGGLRAYHFMEKELKDPLPSDHGWVDDNKGSR